MPKKHTRKILTARKVLITICLGIAFLFCLFYLTFRVKNPYNRPITDPHYKEVYVGSPANIIANPNGILITINSKVEPEKIIVIQTQTAKIISVQDLPEIPKTQLDINGPYWRDANTAIIPPLGDTYGGECEYMFIGTGPSWKFYKEPCDKEFFEKYKYRTLYSIFDGSKELVPEGTDTRGSNVGMLWVSNMGPIYSPQRDLVAFQVADRYYSMWTEGNKHIQDIRLVSNKGCFVSQIGNKNGRGGPEIVLVGWTKHGDLLVYKRGWLKDRQLGFFLIPKTEIQKMKDSSTCNV